MKFLIEVLLSRVTSFDDYLRTAQTVRFAYSLASPSGSDTASCKNKKLDTYGPFKANQIPGHTSNETNTLLPSGTS